MITTIITIIGLIFSTINLIFIYKILLLLGNKEVKFIEEKILNKGDFFIKKNEKTAGEHLIDNIKKGVQ